MLSQPGLAVFGPAMDGGGPIAAADDGADRDDNNIDEEMFTIASVPRVVERFEVGGDGVWSRVVFRAFQAAGLSLMPSLKTVPLTTSTRSGEPFNDRQPFDALSISLNTIVRHATRLPLPLVLS